MTTISGDTSTDERVDTPGSPQPRAEAASASRVSEHGSAVERSTSPSSRDVCFAAFAGVVATVVRLPFLSDYLVNFDSVNFAFGMEGFDLERHEPHPPGYLGFVLLARGVQWFVGDANRSLTLLSAITAGIATALLYLLARRVATRRSALVATVLFGLSPLAWYYGTVGLSYMPGAALALTIVWACHHARFDRSLRHATLAAVALAALGALRQTDIILYAPLVWFSTAPLTMRVRMRLVALAAGLSVLWLAPLLVLSGGPVEYIQTSRELAELAGGRTSVFGLDVVGIARNFRLVATGMVFGVFAAAIPLAVVVRRGLATRDEHRFVLLWTVPSLVVFLLVHTGQLGYVLPILPVVYLALARGLDRRRERPTRAGAALAGVGVLVGLSVLGFAVLPGAALDFARSEGDVSVPLLGSVPKPAVAEIRPIDVDGNDAHWRALIAQAEQTDPERTAILALPNTSVSFRHLAFYLRDHQVYAVGIGRDGSFGHLFSARDGETDYSVEGLASPARTLTLEPGVAEVVLFDLAPDDVRIGAPTRWSQLDDGTDYVRIDVGDAAELRFTGSRTGGVGIDLVEDPA